MGKNLKKKQSKQEKTLNVFIGYDDAQDLSYRVCKDSLLTYASRPLVIYPLRHRELRKIGLLDRPWEISGTNGYSIDQRDGRPFSTNFAFTRFLVPHYAKYLGVKASDPCLFVDSDFVFLRDPYLLCTEQDVEDKPLWAVKHNYTPENIIKMNDQSQTQYSKKLWSSLMLFNLMNPKAYPPLDKVNNEKGTWLHGFNWIDLENIGSLHEGWNYIPDHSEARVKPQDIRAIHFTEGTPLMKPGCRYAEVFNNHLRNVLNEAAQDISLLEDK